MFQYKTDWGIRTGVSCENIFYTIQLPCGPVRFHSVLDQHQDIVVALESRMNPVVEPFVEFDPVAARIAAEQDNHLGRYGPADVLCEDFEFLRFALRQVSE